MKTEGILVSICCVTYNHEAYIRQCLDGFVLQKTNFAYEILVHEDASTDATAEIVKEYELRYPQLFKCVYQSENQFLKQNTLVNILFKMAKGKYLALCEGDDYWTDPYKLQKQVDFLEANPDYSLVVHDAIKTDESGNVISNYYFKPLKSTFIQRDIMQLGCQTPTCSMVFRADSIKSIDPVLLEIMCDQILELVITDKGKMFYMPDSMAAYRIHPGGTWSSKKNIDRYREALLRWKIIKSIDRYYKNYKQEIDEAIVMSSKEICEDIVSLISSRKIYYGFVIYKHSPKKGFKTVIYLLKTVVFPQLYNLYKEKIRGVGKVGVH